VSVSNVGQQIASLDPLAFAVKREKAKMHMYVEPCRRASYAFNAFVVESTGALGQSALEFLKRICVSMPYTTWNGGGGPDNLMLARQKLSVCLHRSNSRSVRVLLDQINRGNMFPDEVVFVDS